MTPSTLEDLRNLTDVLFQAELQNMQHILAQEVALRRDLDRLDTHRKTNLALPIAQLHHQRRIGADVQWQAWVGRTRADLNRQLALCLAQKERMLTSLRRAHGRHQAATEIATSKHQSRRSQRDKRERETEENLAMLNEFQARRSLPQSITRPGARYL